MIYTSAMRTLENDRTKVMYRKGTGIYVHLTDGFALNTQQIKEATGVNYDTLRMGRMMISIVDGLARPWHPSSDDLLATDWQVREVELPDSVPMYSGVIIVSQEDKERMIQYMEGWGYGRFISSFTMSNGSENMFFESRIFSPVRSGEATPVYTVFADEVDCVLTAKKAG